MTQPNLSRFHDSIAGLVAAALNNIFAGQSLSSINCMTVYNTIFNNVVDVFQTSKLKLSSEFINYIAQHFYGEVVINDKQILDPNIFTQRAQLQNIETSELEFLAVFFRGTDHLPVVMHELKKR